MQWIGDDMYHRRVGVRRNTPPSPSLYTGEGDHKEVASRMVTRPQDRLVEQALRYRKTKSEGDLLVVTRTLHHPPYPLKEDVFSTGVLSNILLR